MNEFDQDKTEEPSQSRIEEFRKRGEVAFSKDLTSILILSASTLCLAIGFVHIYEVMSEFLQWISQLDSSTAFTGKAFKTILYKTIRTALSCLTPIALTTLVIGFLSSLGQIGFLFSTDILELKFDRINPLNGFKRIFSMRSIVEALKGIFKFLVILGIVYFFIKYNLQKYQNFFHVSFIQGFLHSRWILAEFSFFILGGLFFIAILDFGYQKTSYKKRLMMTKDELKKEKKEKEGDPEIKHRIRSIQRDIATKRMMNDVKKSRCYYHQPNALFRRLKI